MQDPMGRLAKYTEIYKFYRKSTNLRAKTDPGGRGDGTGLFGKTFKLIMFKEFKEF